MTALAVLTMDSTLALMTKQNDEGQLDISTESGLQQPSNWEEDSETLVGAG